MCLLHNEYTQQFISVCGIPLPSGNRATTAPLSSVSSVCSNNFALLCVFVSTGKTPAAFRIFPTRGIRKNRARAQKWQGLEWGNVAMRTMGSNTMLEWLAAINNGPSAGTGALQMILMFRKYAHNANLERYCSVMYVFPSPCFSKLGILRKYKKKKKKCGVKKRRKRKRCFNYGRRVFILFGTWKRANNMKRPFKTLLNSIDVTNRTLLHVFLFALFFLFTLLYFVAIK